MNSQLQLLMADKHDMYAILYAAFSVSDHSLTIILLQSNIETGMKVFCIEQSHTLVFNIWYKMRIVLQT